MNTLWGMICIDVMPILYGIAPKNDWIPNEQVWVSGYKANWNNQTKPMFMNTLPDMICIDVTSIFCGITPKMIESTMSRYEFQGRIAGIIKWRLYLWVLGYHSHSGDPRTHICVWMNYLMWFPLICALCDIVLKIIGSTGICYCILSNKSAHSTLKSLFCWVIYWVEITLFRKKNIWNKSVHHQWFRKWKTSGAGQATNYYLNQWWWRSTASLLK